MSTSRVTSAPKRVEKDKVDDNKVVRKKFSQEDGIMCRSVTVGELWFEGAKSHITYNWVDYGDENEVEYRDLAAAVRSRSGFIYGPRFIIEDEDFIAEFPQLKKFYDEQYTVEDLKGVLNMNVNDMVDTIKTLPKSAVDSLKSIASTQIVNGQLDSMKKIKALDEIFGTELNLLSTFVN